jgi:hypothetical protein
MGKQEVECACCGLRVETDGTVPAADDDAAWAAEADQHADDCEWLRTRGHRRCADCGGRYGPCWPGHCVKTEG